MIIDDQPTLARAIHRMLTADDVTTATSAREALDLIERGERFDVILSDLMMPDISGMELHGLLQRLAPDQVDKMIFMTGGAFTSQSRAFIARVGNPTIEKPFDKSDLVALMDRRQR